MHICTSSNANNATAQQGHEKSERRLAERCASASVIKSLSISIVVVQRRESRYGLIRLGKCVLDAIGEHERFPSGKYKKKRMGADGYRMKMNRESAWTAVPTVS
jgi:hypothetical protein